MSYPIALERRSWREGRKLYGQIERGQIWKKRDSGKIMQIGNRIKDNRWGIRYSSGIGTHNTSEYDIYRHYDRIR